MRTYLANLLTWSTLINLVDILVVWYVIYRLIMLVCWFAVQRRFNYLKVSL